MSGARRRCPPGRSPRKERRPKRGRGSRQPCAGLCTEIRRCDQKALVIPGLRPYLPPCPILHVPVAACRSVDIRTRGRTAARDKGSLSGDIPEARTPDPQGAASRTTTGSRRLNRRTPLSTGDAAQSNDGTGFFGLVGPPKVDTEEACPSCPACGWGLPIPNNGSFSGEEPVDAARVSNARPARLILPR